MTTLLTGARLFTGDRIIEGHALLVDGTRIVDVPRLDADLTGVDRVDLPEGSLLAPGFIDVQVNGGGGVLFNDEPTPEAAMAIAAALRPSGTTGLLPTFITDDRERMRAAAEAGAAAVARPGSGVLGVHLEGPFISPRRSGCHNPSFIRHPDAVEVERLVALSAEMIRSGGRLMMTLAPEEVDTAVIARLAAAGIVVSVGHTSASYEVAAEALAHGARGFTHLTNAMPPVVNREPGPVIAGLAHDGAWCGVIADGVHVHPGFLRVMSAAKPAGKLYLVTDAMPPVGTDATSFQLYGETILRRDGRLVTVDGVLAGADITMIDEVRNCMKFMGVLLEEALRMASLYPATFLGLDDRLGRLAPGYRADLVLIDADFSVRSTWIAGVRADHPA
jgi:N-acetylglucosamine-6-phosphate deacetylase